MFTLVEVECIGACDKAPAVMIDDELFECVAPENVKNIVASFREAD
jgi:NADH:ubiquinone oxidoreductase subunit E